MEVAPPTLAAVDAYQPDPSNFFLEMAPDERLAGDVYYDFQVTDAGGAIATTAMAIRGQDGFGTNNPVANVQLKSANSTTSLLISNTGSNKDMLLSTTDSGQLYIQEQSTTAHRIMLASNGNIGIGLDAGISPDNAFKMDINGAIRVSSITETSDRRWKKNIRELKNRLQKILALRPVDFEWRTKEFPGKNFWEGTFLGFIAQEIEQVFPDLVRTDSAGYKSLDYSKLLAPVVQALQEQDKKIESLTRRLENQERRLQIIEQQLSK